LWFLQLIGSEGSLATTLSDALDLVICLAQTVKSEGDDESKEGATGDISLPGLVDPDLPFRVLEDWFQVLSVEGCELVWGLLEDRSLILTDEQVRYRSIVPHVSMYDFICLSIQGSIVRILWTLFVCNHMRKTGNEYLASIRDYDRYSLDNSKRVFSM
jgi:hypothetical protein